MAMARESVAMAARSAVSADAKLALLEDLQRCSDAAAAAQSAAEWIVAHAGAERVVFAAPDRVRGMLFGIAGAGVSPRQFKKLSLSLDEAAHPLVSALTNGTAISFHSPRDTRLPLFGDVPFTSVQVGGGGDRSCARPHADQSGNRLLRHEPQVGRRRARPLSARTSSMPVGGSRGRRSAPSSRARPALQHHQRRDRSDPVHEHGRAAHHRERACGDAVYRAGRRQRGPPSRGAAEQHVFLRRAVTDGDSARERPDAASCCSSIRPKDPTCCSSCSARSSAIRAKARASCRFCATSPTFDRRRGRSTRTTQSCARPKPRFAPSAIG